MLKYLTQKLPTPRHPENAVDFATLIIGASLLAIITLPGVISYANGIQPLSSEWLAEQIEIGR